MTDSGVIGGPDLLFFFGGAFLVIEDVDVEAGGEIVKEDEGWDAVNMKVEVAESVARGKAMGREMAGGLMKGGAVGSRLVRRG